MGHDASKVLMGSTESSDRLITCENADPASFPAGRAVRRDDAIGALGLLLADGSLIGVSAGKSLSDTKKTAVIRTGNRVPLEIASYLTKANLTFIAKRPVAIAIEFLAGASAGSEIATLTGDDEAGYLVSLSMDNVSTKSTATQCKTALDANADVLALMETVIQSGQGATEQSAFAEDDIDGVVPVIGAAVTVSNVTGKGAPAGFGSLTGAVYVSGVKTGVDPYGGADKSVALIDMGGGL